MKTSALEIFARGSNPPKNCVWYVNKNTGVFSGTTGKGVIIGIIDSGIEWRHLNFMTTKKTGFSEQTRILRIWDQEMDPIEEERKPNVALLTGGDPYGVEYTKEDINADIAFLSGVSDEPPKVRIRHKDDDGHGTHVAGIAAGNGRQPSNKSGTPFIYTGIAPEAELVIVKYAPLRYISPANEDIDKQFQDAITYILKVADAQDPKLPVVINCTTGHGLGAHDGLGDRQVFLEAQFHSEPGKICVFAAGNKSGNNQHAVVNRHPDHPHDYVELAFELYDKRTLKKDTIDLRLDFWYRNNVANLSVQFKPPEPDATLPDYSSKVALNNTDKGPFDGNKKFIIDHYSKTVITTVPQLTRNNIRVKVTPHGDLHRTGIYEVRLNNVPVNSDIHVWCSQLDEGYGFKVEPEITPPGVPVAVRVTDDNTIMCPGDTRSVITVAAYDHHVKDGNNDGVDDDSRRMYCYSSKGPLVDYSGSDVLASKPDISAPGVNIVSANSYQTGKKDTYSKSKWHLRTDYVPKTGTSLAAAHITGVVALMLQKNGNQTVEDIKIELDEAARAKPSGYPDLHPCGDPVKNVLLQAKSKEAGSGKVDAKTTLKNIAP